MVRASIKQTMEMLSSSLFVQIHRSFIISLNWIDKIEDNHVFISDREIPIGLTYKSEFLKRIEVH
jgi:DNA-binding LytR/AlgR family response regulator